MTAGFCFEPYLWPYLYKKYHIDKPTKKFANDDRTVETRSHFSSFSSTMLFVSGFSRALDRVMFWTVRTVLAELEAQSFVIDN